MRECSATDGIGFIARDWKNRILYGDHIHVEEASIKNFLLPIMSLSMNYVTLNQFIARLSHTNGFV